MAFLLTVICIGINWSFVWYLLVPNTIYGIVAYIVAHVRYFSDDGQKCKDVQENRAAWLLVEIIAFWCLFFIFAFPFFVTMLMGKERADATLIKNYLEEGEEGSDDEGNNDNTKVERKPIDPEAQFIQINNIELENEK